MLHHVLEWVRDQGGVQALGERNARKAAKLYEILDASSLYLPHARTDSRSLMNVTWRLAGADDAEVQDRTKRFVAASVEADMSGLKGHRSVGGVRASIYNAFPEAGVDALCEFMREFERKA
jgi:phosphoserine aminotransferase